MKHYNYSYIILIIAVILLTGRCAKMGSISGGPKDEDPPVVVFSKPVNYSTNFKGNRIEITFDEFISLNNVNQALVVSPPLKEKPEIRLKGKTILVNIPGDLRDSTTYTFNFGNSIEDNNERNVLNNFEFVFSTGSILDSLCIEGSVKSAFNLQPSEDPIIIMVYDKLEDSIPMQEAPVYIGRSDKNGNFRISNLKADTFKIFGLKDLNFNYIYDLPNETIAFCDSLVYLFPEFLEPYVPDTITPDTLMHDSDSVNIKKGDSNKKLPSRKKKIRLPAKDEKIFPALSPYYIKLFFFEEDKIQQFLVESDRKEDKLIYLVFNLPHKEDLSLTGINFDNKNWYLEESNITRDTFNLWIKDTDLISTESLQVLLNYNTTDSLGNIVGVKDTLDFTIHQKRQTKGKADITVKKSDLSVQTIPNNHRQDLHTDLFFEFNYPVDKFDTSRIFLFSIKDSIETAESFSFREDTLSLRKHYLVKSWESKLKYRLFIEPGGFTDIYGRINDSIQIQFSAQDEEYYGTLHVKTSNVYCPLIVQLMDEKENIFEEKFIQDDSVVTFSYLSPGKYKVKYIYDYNSNQKWDTGNYLKKMQPEKVAYYEEEISIRSNWELEIKYEIE